MTKITYVGESPSVEWHGQRFTPGKAVETENAALIQAAKGNTLFEVEEKGEPRGHAHAGAKKP